MSEPPRPPGRPDRPDGEADPPPPSASIRATRTFARLPRIGPAGLRARLAVLLHVLRWRRIALGHALGHHLARIARDDHVYLVILAALVGIAAGTAAALLLAWIEWAHRLFPEPGGDGLERAVVLVAVPTAGGLLVGLLRAGVHRILRIRIVEGAPGVIEAVGIRRGEIRGASAPVAGLGTGLSIASGASVGHEGPSVAIGATMGSVLARFFGMRHRRHVALVGAGAAAGIAAAFNAPLAGVIFAVELVFGSTTIVAPSSLHTFLPLIVAAVASTFTSYAIAGERAEFLVSGFSTPAVREIAGYVALAVVVGAAGALFVRLVVRMLRFAEGRPAPGPLLPAAAGLVVGVLALASGNNDVLGPGAGAIETALRGELLWQAAAVLFAAKFVASAVSLGFGAFGGAFMPSLVLGACLGTVVGTASLALLGMEQASSVPYALVGMGAMFAALMHAPLTPIVMIFELTRDYGLILPLMLACILAAFVARKLGAEPFYRAILHARGVVLPDEREDRTIRTARVASLVAPAPCVLTPAAPLSEIEQALRDGESATVFVVGEAGQVIGVVDGRRLARHVVAGTLSEDSTAADLADRKVAVLSPEDTLAGAILAFARTDLDALPVVDAAGRLLGIVRRADVLARYADELLSREEGALELVTADGLHEEVALAEGVILDHLAVPPHLDGATLAQLDLRGRCGVLVVEWRRGEKLLPIDPRAPLRSGDVLAVVGRRESILEARRLDRPVASGPPDAEG